MMSIHLKKTLGAIFSICFFSASVNAQTTVTVGSTGATYTTLKAAFDVINSGTVTGAITIQVVSGTTETATAALNASGTGSASYSGVTIYPTVTALSITGALAAPLIDLNGADNVIVDGRVNAAGSTKDMVITNTSTSGVAGTCTFRFINDAASNTITYCTLKGSVSLNSYGVIYFGTSSSGSGNDNNTISNNNITNAGTRPVNAVYALGTTGQENSGNIFSSNNFYDFFSTGTGGSAINVVAGNTDWTISGNSFYNVAGWNPGNTSFNIIFINNTAGNNFTINGNYLGGSAPSCGGTAFTKGGAGRDGFGCIYLIVGTAVASSVQGNTIQNFNITNNSNTRNLTGIEVDAGSVNIGTSTGNIIGAGTVTGSITGFNVPNFWGILTMSGGTINIENNTIGSVTSNVGSTAGVIVQGISCSGAGNVTIRNNTIGSTSTANSINASSAATAAGQQVFGIISSSSGVTTISGNTIANLANNASSAGSYIAGIYNGAGAAGSIVSGNFIRSLALTNASSSAETLYGINITGGTATYSNNIISIGDNASATINGLSDAAGTNNLYFNTVYIGGAPATGSVQSFALFSNGVNTRNYRNNLLVNARSNSGATGNNYAIGLNSSPGTIDYNDYYAPGTNGILGVLNSVDKTTLAAWKLASLQDCNSYNESPSFAIAGGTLAANYLPADISLMAAAGTGVSSDFTTTSRNGSKPAMGAYEYAISPGSNSLYVSSFTPVTGRPGDNISITGTNFNNATIASFNGVPATSFTINSPTSITAVVPMASGTGPITVGLTCGSVAGIGNFTALFALPLRWLSFSARPVQESVLLQWSTASEQDTKDFIVEHGTDGSNWSIIGTATAAGNSSSVTEYSYTHPTPPAGNNYYRLQQRDNNGKTSYSKVINLQFKSSAAVLHIYGNPVSNGQLLIQLSKAATVSLFGQGGQLLFRRLFASGLQVISLNGYAKGVYQLKAGNELQRVVID